MLTHEIFLVKALKFVQLVMQIKATYENSLIMIWFSFSTFDKKKILEFLIIAY